MTFTEWFIFFLVVQVIHFAGTWKLYQKAGRKAWEALIPIYNAVILMKIINRPWWWVILLFIPIVNLIMFPVIWVETLRSFGKNSTADTWLGILTLGFYIYYVNYTQDVKHIKDRSIKPKTTAGEWVSSILFAVVAATIVHGYFMQPFTIPTSSLEKTLLVGDYLFVSKFHYGARIPQTPIAFPMVHDTIPGIGIKSYASEPQIPYFRLPGFEKVKKNDIVVFNWPVDTVNAFHQYGDGKYYHKPIDKKSNYVKRCVATPGDSLEIIAGKIHINGKPLQLSERAKPQYSYQGTTNGQELTPQYMYQMYDITDGFYYNKATNEFIISALPEEAEERLKNNPYIKTLERRVYPEDQKTASLFPNDKKKRYNLDYFGPIYIPEEGKTVKITPESLPYYRRIIEVYEGSEMGINNEISLNGTQVLLNGKPFDSYTFKQNYYWMMGDNRHNSEDSRSWGYVPYNHVVGKPVFIWFSKDKYASGFLDGIRWDRMFTTVKGEGKPVSYLPYFLILLVIFFGFNYFRKRKKSDS